MNRKQVGFCGSLFVVATLWLSPSVTAQDFSDDNAAVLVTEATLAQYGKGKVLGYFPQALISRDPLRRTKGYFIFDSGTQAFERTQIPLQIKFERGTRQLDEATKTWKEITPDKFEYSLATDVMLGKLRSLLAESKVIIGADYLPQEPFTGLKSISKDAPVSRYLLKKGTETSYLVEIGNRSHLEALHKTVSLNDASSQSVNYHKHFKSRALQIHLFKLHPGQRPTNPRIVQGVALARHHNPAMTEGRVVISYGPEAEPWTMATNGLSFVGDVADFEFLAAPFLENVISPLLTEKGQPSVKLECVIGEDENETACKKSKEGTHLIKGQLGAESVLTFVVEKVTPGAEKGDSYHDLFRIELHSAK